MLSLALDTVTIRTALFEVLPITEVQFYQQIPKPQYSKDSRKAQYNYTRLEQCGYGKHQVLRYNRPIQLGTLFLIQEYNTFSDQKKK